MPGVSVVRLQGGTPTASREGWVRQGCPLATPKVTPPQIYAEQWRFLFLLRIKGGGAPAVSSTGNQGAPLWRDPMETHHRKTYAETAATVPISLRARHKIEAGASAASRGGGSEQPRPLWRRLKGASEPPPNYAQPRRFVPGSLLTIKIEGRAPQPREEEPGSGQGRPGDGRMGTRRPKTYAEKAGNRSYLNQALGDAGADAPPPSITDPSPGQTPEGFFIAINLHGMCHPRPSIEKARCRRPHRRLK